MWIPRWLCGNVVPRKSRLWWSIISLIHRNLTGVVPTWKPYKYRTTARPRSKPTIKKTNQIASYRVLKRQSSKAASSSCLSKIVRPAGIRLALMGNWQGVWHSSGIQSSRRGTIPQMVDDDKHWLRLRRGSTHCTIRWTISGTLITFQKRTPHAPPIGVQHETLVV